MMIETMVKAVVGITFIAGGMLSVQMAWRRVFAGTFEGQNPMVDRCGCSSCCRPKCDAAAAENEQSAPAPQNKH